jgi:hypothetical protein
MLNPSAVGFPPPRCHSFATAASIGSSPIIAHSVPRRPQRTKVWLETADPAQEARRLTGKATARRMFLPARPNCGVMRCRLFHVDRTIGIIMIAAMLTLVVVVVALMFAAEIGWLMVDPTRRGK